MDALVLSVVASESTYGYKITQDVRSVMEVSESTLYPVLHRSRRSGLRHGSRLAHRGLAAALGGEIHNQPQSDDGQADHREQGPQIFAFIFIFF